MASLGSVEIRTAEYRPCHVNGKKALFHRWVDGYDAFVKRDREDRCIYSCEDLEFVKNVYEEKGYLHSGFDVDVCRRTVAIVEFEDGTVAEVKPTDVRFVPGLMYNYCFGEENNETRNDADS